MGFTYLKRQWCKLLKVEHVIITNSDDEIGLSLRNIRKDFECSIVVE